MKKKEETKFECEFCKSKFSLERTLTAHLCKYKKRWLDRDDRANQLALQCFVQFMRKNSLKKTIPTYEEFIKSVLYTSFVKFGKYCIEIRCVNVPRLVEYYVRQNIKLDTWTSDENYTKFLIDYLKTENPIDAVERTMNHCAEMAETESIQSNDYLRYGNRNKICYAITAGRISPWVLYQSESGVKVLEEFTEDQLKIIYDYINPTQWAIKFSKDSENVELVKEVLNLAKW